MLGSADTKFQAVVNTNKQCGCFVFLFSKNNHSLFFFQRRYFHFFSVGDRCADLEKSVFSCGVAYGRTYRLIFLDSTGGGACPF